MANKFPLTINSATQIIEELPSGDNLNLTGSDISNVGNITVALTSNLGAISNVKITGGSANFVIKTDSLGNLSFTNVVPFATTANAVAGANVSGQVSFAAVANSVAAANVVGTVATATTAGTVTTAAQPNITSTGILTSLDVTGNITGGNISTTGTANINIANITDVIFTGFNERVLANANTSTSISPNVDTGTIFRYTANANFTMNSLTNAVAGTSATIIITQDATGSRLLTSTMKFAGGSKTLSTAAASIDIIGVFFDGTTYYASLTKAYA